MLDNHQFRKEEESEHFYFFILVILTAIESFFLGYLLCLL